MGNKKVRALLIIVATFLAAFCAKARGGQVTRLALLAVHKCSRY